MRIAVDASAVLAILLREPDATLYLTKLMAASKAWISPVNWWEVQVRIHREFGDEAARVSAAWMASEVRLIVEPITPAHAATAFEASLRFRGGPARLNLGDCFAYALAKARQVPLLYKGLDFAKTGIQPA